MPDLTAGGPIERHEGENDLSDVRSSEAADSRFGSSMVDARRIEIQASIACNCRDAFSTGRDSRRSEVDEEQLDHGETMMTIIISRLVSSTC
jgi:hypothetical protein